MPVEVTTTVVGKTERTSITNTVSGYATYHEIPVIGLYNGENTVMMELRDQASGEVDTYTLQIETEDMPDVIKNKEINLTACKPEKLSDGLYVLKDYHRTLIDLNGDIRGYFTQFALHLSGIDEITDNGHIFASSEAYSNYATIFEFDAMGFVYREIQIPLTAHHDALLRVPNKT